MNALKFHLYMASSSQVFELPHLSRHVISKHSPTVCARCLLLEFNLLTGQSLARAVCIARELLQIFQTRGLTEARAYRRVAAQQLIANQLQIMRAQFLYWSPVVPLAGLLRLAHVEASRNDRRENRAEEFPIAVQSHAIHPTMYR
jgi:hypothetical protein